MKLRLASDAKYLFAIVSDQNIKESLLNAFVACASPLTNTRLYFLTRNCHPNEPCAPDQIHARITVCAEAFEALEHEVQQSIAEPLYGL